MPQSAAHPVASDCRSASSADDKAHSCRRTRGFCIGGSRGVVRSRQVHDDRAAAGPSPTPRRHPKVTSQAQTVRRGQHGSVLRVRLARRRGDDGDRSGGKPLAALTPTVAQDGAPSTGTHPQAESVGLVPTAIVRLEGALAHGFAPGSQAQRSRTARRPTVTCNSLFTGAPAGAGGRTAPRYARGSERVKRPGHLRANPAPARVGRLWTTACWCRPDVVTVTPPRWSSVT